MPRSPLLRFVALVAGLLALVAPVAVLAQSNTDVYVNLSVGDGGSDAYSGFVQSSYGSVDPDGYNNGTISGSVSRITWNDVAKEMRVVLTATPAAPLMEVGVEYGDVYTCTPTSNRTYACRHADNAKPWGVGDTRRLRLRFAIPELPPDITGSPTARFPTPTPLPGVLLGAYGARTPSGDIQPVTNATLPTSIGTPGNSNYDGVYSDGQRLYVLDDADDHIYVYNLSDGSRDMRYEWKMGDGTWRGLTYAKGKFWSTHGGALYSFEDTTYLAAAAPKNKSAAIPITGRSSISNTYRMHTINENEFALTYRISSTHHLGRFGFDGAYVSDSSVAIPSSQTLSLFVDVENDRLWLESAGEDVARSQGGSGYGVAVYDWSRYVGGELDRVAKYDVYTVETNSSDNQQVGNFIWVQGPTLYVQYRDESITNTGATRDNDQYKFFAYNVNPALIFDDAASPHQRPPIFGDIEVKRTYTSGEAELADIEFTWQDASYVEGGVTAMEYRYRSAHTGQSPEEAISADSNKHTIKGLQRGNYDLQVDLRYRWYNSQDPTHASSQHVLIRNPPGVTDEVCASENTDEYPNDGIKATENADTTQIGCAFYLEPGEERYSAWVRTRVALTGPLLPVQDRTIVIEEPYSGFVSAVADMLLVAGMDIDGVGPLARTLAMFFWFIIASVAAAGLYLATGMKTGSMYLATFAWLIIWAGLGPFVAMMPYSMAYMPVALLMLAGAILVVKRGKV